MRCRKVQKLLPLYDDGALPARLAEGIASHLAACGECGREATELGEALGALRRLPPVRPTPALKRAVVAAVRREAVRSRQGAREWVLLRQPVFATVAVTACVLLGAVGLWMHGAQTPGTPVPTPEIVVAPNAHSAPAIVADAAPAVPPLAPETPAAIEPAPAKIVRVAAVRHVPTAPRRAASKPVEEKPEPVVVAMALEEAPADDPSISIVAAATTLEVLKVEIAEDLSPWVTEMFLAEDSWSAEPPVLAAENGTGVTTHL